MEKGDLKKEEVVFLSQLIKSLDEASIKLNYAYENKDYEAFNKLKKFIFEVQKKISEVLK